MIIITKMNKDTDEESESKPAYNVPSAQLTNIQERNLPKVASSLVPKKTGKKSPPSSGNVEVDADKPKRKRKPPEKPWKKPPDMPKRPLSAYNLFFKDERKRIVAQQQVDTMGQGELNARGKKIKMDTTNLDNTLSPDVTEDSEQGKASLDDSKVASKKKPNTKKSGVGFAGLAKKISTKWNALSDETKEPYEKIAAVEKRRYDGAVGIYRKVKEEEKKQAKIAAAAAINELANQPTLGDDPLPFLDVDTTSTDYIYAVNQPRSQSNLQMQRLTHEERDAATARSNFDQSVDSFSDHSQSYPDEWFETGVESVPLDRNNMHGMYESNVLQRDEGRVSFIPSHPAHQDSLPQRQENRYSFGHDATYSTSFVEASSGSQSRDMDTSMRSVTSREGSRDYYLHQQQIRQDRELEMDRQRSLHQYHAYLQQRDDLQQHQQRQLIQRELELERNHQEFRRQEEIQLQQEAHQQRQNVIRHLQRNNESQTRVAHRSRSNNPTQQSRLLHSSNSSFVRAGGQQPNSVLTSRPTTPQYRSGLEPESVFSPLTPVFGLPLEDQLAERRVDRPFLLNAVGAQLPIPSSSLVEDSERRNGNRLSVPLSSNIPNFNQDRLNRVRDLTSVIQPRRTTNMFHDFQVEENKQAPSEAEMFAFRTYPDDYASQPSNIIRGGVSAHRSASLPYLAPTHPLQRVQRDEDHRRYSVSGPSFDRRVDQPLPRSSHDAVIMDVDNRNIIQLPDARLSPHHNIANNNIANTWAMASNHGGDISTNTPRRQQQQQQSEEHLTPDATLTNSIQSLSEKLDDEAIDFLTSMNKDRK